MDATPEDALLMRDTWVAIHVGLTLAILGLVTTSVLVANFTRVKDLRKPLNFIYLNLFVFDALVLVAVAVGELGRYSIRLPYLPKVACQIEGAFVGIGGLGVLACLAQIGWERYNIVIKNVEHPLRVYQLAMTTTWVYVTTLSIAMGSINGCVQNPGTSTCIAKWSSRDPRQMAIILISGGLLLALSSTAMVVSYGSIGKKIWGVRKEVLEHSAALDSRIDAEIGHMLQRNIRTMDLRLALNGMITTLTFFVLWGGYSVGVILYGVVTGMSPRPAYIEEILSVMAFSHSITDIVIVTALDPTLRNGLRAMFVGRATPSVTRLNSLKTEQLSGKMHK